MSQPPILSGAQIRQTFLNFFGDRQHQILPSASLVPEDPTVLLTIAGMLPFKPIFLGQKTPDFSRATTAQKCIRTNDIENVGKTARHHTFFEMLGNFSFGDYFKEQAIVWAWELSTQVFKLPPERLVVSVFTEDEEAFALWRERIGIPPHRIQRLGAKDNFWVSGPTGPCGPCSEIYYDFQPELGDENIDLEDDTRFIEFYNLVFMQYNRDAQGQLTPLAQKNIDTGMGLERMAQILQQVPNNYETDLIFPIVQRVAHLAGINYKQADEKTQISLKVIGDHIRSVVHMMADGISASNLGRGYVLRRLIRRVVRHGQLLGITGEFTPQVAETAIQLGEEVYPALRERQLVIKQELAREEAAFLKTLARGEKLLAELMAQNLGQISGVDAFTLYDTYGFPLELTQEIAAEQGLTVDEVAFAAAMKQQQERSKAAHAPIDITVQGSLDQLASTIHPTTFLGYQQSESSSVVKAVLGAGQLQEQAEAGDAIQIILDQTPFYAESGGQIGDRGYLRGENLLVRIEDVKKESGIFVHFGRVERGLIEVGMTITATIDRACRRRVQAHHTATHLLQAALRKVVGEDIAQAGSLVDFNRLRFDFNCPRSLTVVELNTIEDWINTWIAEAHDTQIEVLPLAEAKKRGAIAMFGEKYGEQVRVIDVPGVSMELCGGTHVKNTAEIGLFKIIAETGIASGIRRLEGVAGPAVLGYLQVREQVVKELGDRLKVKPEEITQRVHLLQEELKQTQRLLASAQGEMALLKAEQLLDQAETIQGYGLLVANLGPVDAESLKIAAERLQHKLGEGVVVLGSSPEADKVSLVAAFSPRIVQEKHLQAGKFIGQIAKICGGGGGGRPHLAQAGGREPQQLEQALMEAKTQLRQSLS